MTRKQVDKRFVDKRFVGRTVILCALVGALWLAAATAMAQITTSVSVCGTVSAFTAATLTTPGSITIGGQTIPIAANTTIDGSGLIHPGANLCLNGTLNALGLLVAPSSVTANVTTTVSVCGVVSAFTAATATSPGSITIGGQTIPIAANTTIDGSGLIQAGANLCLNGTLNALGQLVAPSSVTANATTTVNVCGIVSAFTAATATSPGSITIGGQTIPIAANTSLGGSGLIQNGANLCLNGTLNALGQLVAPSSVTANATTTVNVCGIVSAYTAATASSPGSITIGGQTIPIAANTTIGGSGSIQPGTNLCLNGTLNALGQLVAPSSVTANAAATVSVCGVVSAFTAATATSPGSITIGGQTILIAANTTIDGSGSIQIGANLCLNGSLNAVGQLVPPSSVSANAATTVSVCGVVSAYTAATATSPGSITIGGQTIPIAANTSLSGSGLIQIGANLCLNGALNALGQLVPPSTVTGTLTVCGLVSALTASTASTPGSITIAGKTFSIAPGVSTNVTVGSTLCLNLALNGAGQVVFLTASGADIGLTKTATPGSVSVGGTLTYTITVVNNGPAAAATVLVSDPLSPNVTFLSATASQGSCSGTTTVLCSVGPLALGQTASVTIVVTPKTPGTLTNTASVSAEAPDVFPGNNISTVISTVTVASAAPRQIIFPVAAQINGAGGSQWRTDLRIVNLGSSPAVVTIEWYPFSPSGHSGPAQTHDVTVGPGAQGVFDQSLKNLFNTTGAGSLRLVSDSSSIGAGLRIYDDQRGAACGGIEGAFEKGLLPSESIPRGALLVLANNPGDPNSFRNSVGYFNASSTSTTIKFTAYSTDGRLLGSKTVAVPAFANDQRSVFDLIDTVAAADQTQQDFYLTYEAAGGLPFVYAFTVFNSNNDPLYIHPWAF